MKIKAALLAALAISSASAQALPLDNLMSCSLSSKDFFTRLVQSQVIETPAYKVTPEGFNAFKEAFPNALTFFGMSVGLVVGYADDPLFFKPGPNGATPAYDGYGFFVQAPPVAVQAILDSAGFKATRVHAEPSGLTLVSCRFPRPQ
ncbi:hypothetical protein PQQ96_06035 [Paraburkholderia sediminicola]|uniref:hypothetical protein n=1 Tax=Paraburkholderia sediminicola TaxID=458836 RepID=UPI0038BBAED6